MMVEVTIPSEFQSSTLQTLNQRDGAIQATLPVSSDTSCIQAVVPLRCMFGYSSELRSVTQGQGEFSMEFTHYEQMPANKQAEMVAAYSTRSR